MFLRNLFNLFRWIFLLLGIFLIAASFAVQPAWGKVVLLAPGILLAVLGLLMVWWYLRPNTSRVSPALNIEVWEVVKDGMHNSNTDLIYTENAFYLVHAVSPFHFANSGCRLHLLHSSDARHWEKLAEFGSPGEDIRDPKLAVIGGKLFLYALTNRSFDPEPYTTVYTLSEDGGRSWLPLCKLDKEGWLFWKPKTKDGITWYAAAYWYEHGKAALYSTCDGINWQTVSIIHSGGLRNDETDIEFLPDGDLLSTARLEGNFKEWSFKMFCGDPQGGTLITRARPPYTEFKILTKSATARLDGPALFSWNGRIFAVGRFQPEIAAPFLQQGSIFARKRTSIYEVTESSLKWLTDVPSAGDTAYAGVALVQGSLYFSYYTSPIEQDYPWIVGMLNPTPIYMAKVDLAKLAKTV